MGVFALGKKPCIMNPKSIYIFFFMYMGETYKTYDLALAACLHANHFPIVDIDKTNPSRVQFIFAHTEQLDRTVTDFWNHRALVDAHGYFNAIKSLKTRIYND